MKTTSKLKAIQPEEVKLKKPKFLLFGKAGVGKSMFALNFPNVYLFDTEAGAERDQYMKLLKKNGGAYFGPEQGSKDFNLVIEEIKSLTTEDHEYRTIVIDSLSNLWLIAAAIAEQKLGNDFARDRKEANRPLRQLLLALDKCDMTVVLICHERDKWVRDGDKLVASGPTFECMEKIEYDLDLSLRVTKTKGGPREFQVMKSRIEAFAEGAIYPLEYGVFAKMYGQDIVERKAEPVVMINEDQIDEISALISGLNVPKDEVEKHLAKVGAESLTDLTSEQGKKFQRYLSRKLDEIKK